MFGIVPWTVPLLWIVVVVTGRAVARLIMRPWRKTNYYGFWVIGLTGTLAALFDLGLEPFATRLKPYWLWQPTLTTLMWHGAPWVNFLGWFVAAAGMVAMTLPWLINKQPVKRPMDYLPLIQWLVFYAWMITGNALAGMGPATAAGVVGIGMVTIFAVRGARW
jgi:uncharacterized membrane protein